MSIKRLSGAGLTTPKSNKLWDQTTFQSGMFAIATVSLTSSASQVTFSNIPATYTHLQIRYIGQLVTGFTGGDNSRVTINGDTNANYSYHQMYGNGSSAYASGGSSSNNMLIAYLGGNGSTSKYAAGVVDILDYTSTSKYKTIRVFSGVDTNSSDGIIFLSSGLWQSTSAVTSVTFGYNNGTNNINQNSHFALYGIKSA
jgi:hypothetical protein